MTIAEYIRLVAKIAVLKEIAMEYPNKTVENIIMQMEARKKIYAMPVKPKSKQEKRKEHQIMSEFENLKVGDQVIVSGRCLYERVSEVTKVTDKQIVVGKSNYWKKNGYEVGGFYRRLVIATDKRIKQIDDRNKSLEMRKFLDKTHWEDLSLKSLTTVVDCVKKELGNSATKQ